MTDKQVVISTEKMAFHDRYCVVVNKQAICTRYDGKPTANPVTFTFRADAQKAAFIAREAVKMACAADQSASLLERAEKAEAELETVSDNLRKSDNVAMAWRKGCEEQTAALSAANARVEELTAERDALREALRPFATVGALLDGPFRPRFALDEDPYQGGAGWTTKDGESKTLTIGDFKRARAALKGAE